MKRKRSSIEQIVAVLKQAELGMPVADVIRQVGISEQTFYRWKKQYAGMQSDQVRELKQLQEENARLKKLVAELSLDKAILQDVASKKWPARAETRRGGLRGEPLRIDDEAGLSAREATAQRSVLPKYQRPALRASVEDAQDCPYAGALRLSTCPRAVAPGRLAVGPEPGVPAVLRRAVAVALKVTAAAKDGGDAGGEDRSDQTKRCVEYGFCGRPAC
ncbi:hypothetical protein LMG29660_05103 [Burkholderia puraquae]|uniref:Transposase n=1 Tax=Burkholderia puraquae TaxID=1904757 RepID=A0A6J5EHF6_9BURK|nr:hypothetical protein LMG29660_05103 [Burkholderia puraquae]